MRRIAVVTLLVVLGGFAAACQRDEEAIAGESTTIAPANPDSLPTSTDAVITQTVDLGDIDRSQAEGEGATAEPPTTTSTANPGKAKTRP